MGVFYVLILLMVDRFNQHEDNIKANYSSTHSTTVNVENLKKRINQERKKNKAKNILVAAAAISAVAVSGFILSL